MKNKYIKTLEFDLIKNKLKEYTISEQAGERAEALVPIDDIVVCNNKIRESAEAKRLIEEAGTPPLGSADVVKKALDMAERGEMLRPELLEQIQFFLTAVKRMQSYLKRCECFGCGIAYMGSAFQELYDLKEAIVTAIRGGEVDRYATPRLKNLTERAEQKKEQIREKLERLLKSKKNCFSDSYIVQRDGHYVLPVRKEGKGQIKGTTYDISATGNTIFIEPDAVTRLQSELLTLEIEADNEIRRILYELTDQVWAAESSLRQNAAMMEELDFIFAKGKLALDMDAVAGEVVEEQQIRIRQGRHPLLEKESCIPLDFEVGGETRGIIITGPNTGGKTVALKTVGLLSVMAGSGLLVPAQEGCRFARLDRILCDIGDGQNISESLSTFSAHMKNVIEILQEAGTGSLVLLDELGSGTDPAEGMGIAVSILEALKDIGCLMLATTHYPEVKEYAQKTAGMLNARMAFDKISLKPLYRLVIGEAGESCALYIAKKLGFPEALLKIADQVAYGAVSYENSDFETGFRKQNRQVHKKQQKKTRAVSAASFDIGDSVAVPPEGKKGIVCAPVNEMGNVQVQVQKQKAWYPVKRVKLLVRAAEMYPEDYDFSIIFDTVQNRKARHEMSRKYVPDVQITEENNQQH